MYNKYLSESEGFSAIGLCIKANIVPCSTEPLQTDQSLSGRYFVFINNYPL